MMQLQHKRAGIAILSVVVVLSTLLIIGVLFAMTVELDLKANKYYREAGRTEMIALEGLYRAIGEIMYDQWGVREDRSFMLANHGKFIDDNNELKYVGLKTRDELAAGGDELALDAAVPNDTKGIEAAYYRTVRNKLMDIDRNNPTLLRNYAHPRAIVRPKSKYRMTIETIYNPNNPLSAAKTEFNVLTDYRWVVETGIAGERGQEAESVSQDKNVFYYHSGAIYHDEFLPEHTDNNDLWELGLHANRANIFYGDSDGQSRPGRLYSTDGDNSYPNYFDPNPPGKPRGWDKWFWYGAYNQADKKNNPWLKYWDYIDTRINGDSYYKIFRTELVYWDEEVDAANGAIATGDDEPSPWRSNAAGVRDRFFPRAGTPFSRIKTIGGVHNWMRMRTHLGYTDYDGDGKAEAIEDPRGGALNINQVNNNYGGETYYAQQNKVFNDPYISFHYRDSKWIYRYNEAGTRKIGRYAVMVWPDCGYPNANYMPDNWEMRAIDQNALREKGTVGKGSNSARRPETFFNMLDTSFSPRGGPLGLDAGSGAGTELYDSQSLANVIKSSSGGDNDLWSRELCTRINNHAQDTGLFNSRAEMNMFLRKSALNPPVGITVTPEELEQDAQVIASNISVHAYESLMGPHWEQDRIIIDYLSTQNNYAGSSSTYQTYTQWIGWQRAPMADGPFTGTGTKSEKTRELIYHTLDNMKYYWGPDDDREGQYTPYHMGEPDDGPNDRVNVNLAGVEAEEADITKSLWLGYAMAAGHVSHLEHTSYDQGESPGYRVDVTNSANISITRNPGSVAANHWKSGITTPYFPKISEVGTLPVSAINAIDSGKGGTEIANFAGGATVYFVEVVDQCSVACNVGQDWYEANINVYVGGVSVADNDLIVKANTGNNGTHADVNPNTTTTGTVRFYRWNKQQESMPQKESIGKYSPSAYALVLFKVQGSGTTVSLRNSNGSVIYDYADLPGPLQNGYSTYDPLSNQHKEMWLETQGVYDAGPGSSNYDVNRDTVDATPAWAGKAPYSSNKPDYAGHDSVGNTSSGSNKAWYHGLNANNVLAYIPGGESLAKPTAPALNNARFSHIDVHGRGSDPEAKGIPGDQLFKWYGVSGLRGSNDDDSSYLAMGRSAWYLTQDHDEAHGFRHAGRFLTIPLGFFPRDRIDGNARTKKHTEPFLRYWADFNRVGPGERYFAPGWLRNKAAFHWGVVVWDAIDNNNDGMVDNMVDDPRFQPGAPGYDDSIYGDPDFVGDPKGHFVGDRAAIGRVNANEIQHPAVVWYCAIGTTRDSWGWDDVQDYDWGNTVIGKKPFKGYTAWQEVLSRATMMHSQQNVEQRIRVPYNIAFWYENQFADADILHAHYGHTIGHLHHTTNGTGRMVYVGNSPVHTIYLTAQSLDAFELPLAEIKVMATIERTWDGKLNMLDFKWMPADASR